MGLQQTPEWFLETQGRKSGPFSIDEIRQLYESGQVDAQSRMGTESMRGQAVLVRDYFAQNASSLFQPPPRPSELPKAGDLPIPEVSEHTNPALSLFEALQVSRERKAASSTRD